jgi:hypothetical protein
MTERWHFSVAWIVWLGLFAVIEAWAIFGSAPRATLSNHIRDWLRHQPTWVWVTFLLFMIWLTVHFVADMRD